MSLLPVGLSERGPDLVSQSDNFRRVSARFNGDDGDGSGRDAHLFLSSTDLGRYRKLNGAGSRALAGMARRVSVAFPSRGE